MTDDAGATPDPKQDAGENPAPPAAEGAESVEGLKSALKAERDARKAGDKKTRDLEARLREIEDRDKSETEKLTQRAAESERRAVEAEATLLRLEVAAERKFTAEAVGLLHGSTREEIEASADRLTAFVKTNSAAPPAFDGGARETPEAKQSPETAHAGLLLRALGREP